MEKSVAQTGSASSMSKGTSTDGFVVPGSTYSTVSKASISQQKFLDVGARKTKTYAIEYKMQSQKCKWSSSCQQSLEAAVENPPDSIRSETACNKKPKRRRATMDLANTEPCQVGSRWAISECERLSSPPTKRRAHPRARRRCSVTKFSLEAAGEVAQLADVFSR